MVRIVQVVVFFAALMSVVTLGKYKTFKHQLVAPSPQTIVKDTTETEVKLAVITFYSELNACHRQGLNFSNCKAMHDLAVDSFDMNSDDKQVICFDTYPDSFVVNELINNPKQAQATVHALYAGMTKLLTVGVQKVGENWKIASVTCPR